MPATRAQRIVSRISRGVGYARGRPRSGLRVLLYHAIGSDVPGARYGLSVPAASFAAQMRWLREESGLTVLPLADAVELLSSGGVDHAIVSLTFDDGYRDALAVAAPILERYRLPFTVFVVSGFLSRPPAPRLYLDSASLRDLAAAAGASIGSHGRRHRALTRLDERGLDEELRESASELATVLGARPLSLSYPYGAVNATVARRAAEAGFRIGGTSLAGVNRAGAAPLRLHRTEIVAQDGLGEFTGKVRGDYDWYQLRQRLLWRVPVD